MTRFTALVLLCALGLTLTSVRAVGITMLPLGSTMRLTADDPDAQDSDYVFMCGHAANMIGVVTYATRSTETAHNIIEAANQFTKKHDPDPSKTEVARFDGIGVFAKSEGNDKIPAVLILPPRSKDMWEPIMIHPIDRNSSVSMVYCDDVDPTSQLLWAAGRTAVVGMFAGSDLGNNDYIARAVNLGISLMSRDNVLAVGVDAVREEIMIKLKEQYPNNLLLVTFIGSFIDNMIQETYKHAFFEMSNKISVTH